MQEWPSRCCEKNLLQRVPFPQQTLVDCRMLRIYRENIHALGTSFFCDNGTGNYHCFFIGEGNSFTRINGTTCREKAGVPHQSHEYDISIGEGSYLAKGLFTSVHGDGKILKSPTNLGEPAFVCNYYMAGKKFPSLLYK